MKFILPLSHNFHEHTHTNRQDTDANSGLTLEEFRAFQQLLGNVCGLILKVTFCVCFALQMEPTNKPGI